MSQGFDPVARVYRALEYAAFGGTLQRARVAFIDRLRTSKDILILGDGDGRFLRALLDAVPGVRACCVDDSQAMLDLAAARLSAEDKARVTFVKSDARQFDAGDRMFDAIVTMFFLDCFSNADVSRLIARLSPHLRADGCWLFADFAIPARGLARLHAQFVVSSLYLFFRFAAGLDVSKLPASEMLLEQHGYRRSEAREFRAGLIRSAVFNRS